MCTYTKDQSKYDQTYDNERADSDWWIFSEEFAPCRAHKHKGDQYSN